MKTFVTFSKLRYTSKKWKIEPNPKIIVWYSKDEWLPQGTTIHSYYSKKMNKQKKKNKTWNQQPIINFNTKILFIVMLSNGQSFGFMLPLPLKYKLQFYWLTQYIISIRASAVFQTKIYSVKQNCFFFFFSKIRTRKLTTL